MCNQHIQIIEIEISALYNLHLEILNIMIIIQSPHSYSPSSWETEVSLPTEHGVINPFTRSLSTRYSITTGCPSPPNFYRLVIIMIISSYENYQNRPTVHFRWGSCCLELPLALYFVYACVCIYVCPWLPLKLYVCASHEKNRLELFSFKSELLGGLHI